MKIMARITVADADGLTVYDVPGLPVDVVSLKIEDATTRLAEAEAYLSRLLGLTVRIETEAA